MYFTIATPFLFSAILFLLTIPIAFTMPFAREVKLSVPLFPVKVMKKNLAVYLAVLVRHTGACSIWVMYPMFIRTLGGIGQNLFFWVGLMYAINSATQFIVMRSLKRRSTVLIPAGLGLSALTFLLFTLCGTVWELMPTQVLLAISWALIYVGSVKERATATGVLNSTLQMSTILGSLIGGVLIQVTSNNYLAPMYLAAVMALFSLGVYFFLVRTRKRKTLHRQREVQYP
jgi:hypothetical protein